MAGPRTNFSLSRAQVRELDRRAVEEFGMLSIVLMENAGRGAAVLMRRLNPEKKRVTILCGPGNNGGDGFVMARHMENHGWPVQVLLFDAREPRQTADAANGNVLPTGYALDQLSPDARHQFAILRRSGIGIAVVQGQLHEETKNYLANEIIMEECWLVDALFGTGLNRALESPFNEIVAMINASDNPVLAIDIPSGLDCDTGEPLGPTVRAKHTATFVAPKAGFQEAQAEPWLGDVHVLDIGVPKILVDQYRSATSGG